MSAKFNYLGRDEKEEHAPDPRHERPFKHVEGGPHEFPQRSRHVGNYGPSSWTLAEGRQRGHSHAQ